MSIKLLPASVNLGDPTESRDVSTGLVPQIQRAISKRDGQSALTSSSSAYSWSSMTERGGVQLIDGTLVEDSQSDETGSSRAEYVSDWDWSRSFEKTAVAHYLFYAAAPAIWSGWLINLYA
jgi:hypothetical protein